MTIKYVLALAVSLPVSSMWQVVRLWRMNVALRIVGSLSCKGVQAADLVRIELELGEMRARKGGKGAPRE